jgi:dihydrofolate reductase
MRKLTGGIFLSLDGVLQAPGGPSEDPTGGFAHGGWATSYFDDTLFGVIGELFTAPYGLLLGRRTYDIFAAHWPYATGEDAAMGEALTQADKYVMTRGDQPLEWANSHRLAGIDDVVALKATDGPDLLIQGSSTLYPQLLERGLIDRLTTMTFPVLLGKGKRPWSDAMPGGALKLVDHKVSGAGVVVATHEPAGAIPIGSFAIAESSDREQERQRRMREGNW